MIQRVLAERRIYTEEPGFDLRVMALRGDGMACIETGYVYAPPNGAPVVLNRRRMSVEGAVRLAETVRSVLAALAEYVETAGIDESGDADEVTLAKAPLGAGIVAAVA